MSGITTHVLDTSRGCPASGVPVTLERRGESGWTLVGSGRTNEDGRLSTLTTAVPEAGTYRLTFETRTYFESMAAPVFYPAVTITFCTAEGERHYHVPLLLNPFGYSTYRGS